MSLISRLRAVVAGDDYLDGDYDELDYDTGEQDDAVSGLTSAKSSALAPLDASNPFEMDQSFSGTNVIGMPGISSSAAEVSLMEPRSFDEMPRAIQAARAQDRHPQSHDDGARPGSACRGFCGRWHFAIDGHQGALASRPVCSQLCHGRNASGESTTPTVVTRDVEQASAKPALPGSRLGGSDATAL